MNPLTAEPDGAGSRLRVLIVGLNYAPEHTGIAPYTAGLAQGLSDHYDVHVVTAHPHYPAWRTWSGFGRWRSESAEGGVSLTRLRHWVPRNPTGLERILSELTFAARVLAVRTARPDVVITVTPALLPVFAVRMLCRIWGVPLGVVVQDFYSRAVVEVGLLGGRGAELARRLEATALQGADSLVAIHERFAVTLAGDLGVAPDRISVIPNWTHVREPRHGRRSLRRSLGWRDDDFVVLHAGNMGAKQGLESVVEAASLARREHAPLRFVLMGDGNQRATLERRAAAAPGVTFLDSVSDDLFPDVLAAADALLLNECPGVVEMCVPSKLTSYFAAGRPVLAATSSASAGAHEVAASGAGVQVPPGDPRALVDGALLLRAEGDGSTRGMKAQTYARTRLSADAAISAYGHWVKGMLDRAAS